MTLGCNWHPIKCLEIRPEIRGDFAGADAFGVNGAHTDRSQLTGGSQLPGQVLKRGLHRLGGIAIDSAAVENQ